MKLVNADCLEALAEVSAGSVDLTVTSPPYDNLREYDGLPFEKFCALSRELFRVTAVGGVCVWVVGDAVIDGSETGTSFRQAIYFMDVGFRLHDTMIYQKTGFSFPMNTRYHQIFEYMFIFSKGSPKTFNPIKDRPNAEAGRRLRGAERQPDGSLKSLSDSDKAKRVTEFGMRRNVWVYPTGAGNMAEPEFTDTTHPAMFPLALAEDHIKTWSNPGDLVLDPFLGSGTTGVAAKFHKRDFLGIEKSPEYFALASKRIETSESEDSRQPSLFAEAQESPSTEKEKE